MTAKCSGLVEEVAYEITKHARTRQQQRGVRPRQLKALLEYADRRCHVGGGQVALTMSRGACQRVRHLVARQDLERLSRLVAVVDPLARCVVTVMHPSACRQRRRRYFGKCDGR